MVLLLHKLVSLPNMFDLYFTYLLRINLKSVLLAVVPIYHDWSM